MAASKLLPVLEDHLRMMGIEEMPDEQEILLHWVHWEHHKLKPLGVGLYSKQMQDKWEFKSKFGVHLDSPIASLDLLLREAGFIHYIVLREMEKIGKRNP